MLPELDVLSGDCSNDCLYHIAKESHWLLTHEVPKCTSVELANRMVSALNEAGWSSNSIVRIAELYASLRRWVGDDVLELLDCRPEEKWTRNQWPATLYRPTPGTSSPTLKYLVVLSFLRIDAQEFFGDRFARRPITRKPIKKKVPPAERLIVTIEYPCANPGCRHYEAEFKKKIDKGRNPGEWVIAKCPLCSHTREWVAGTSKMSWATNFGEIWDKEFIKCIIDHGYGIEKLTKCFKISKSTMMREAVRLGIARPEWAEQLKKNSENESSDWRRRTRKRRSLEDACAILREARRKNPLWSRSEIKEAHSSAYSIVYTRNPQLLNEILPRARRPGRSAPDWPQRDLELFLKARAFVAHLEASDHKSRPSRQTIMRAIGCKASIYRTRHHLPHTWAFIRTF
ncbi:hypothetical protein J2852_001097 [Azospirillum soli]|nr:hypothetical protein [Azospirillum soli]